MLNCTDDAARPSEDEIESRSLAWAAADVTRRGAPHLGLWTSCAGSRETDAFLRRQRASRVEMGLSDAEYNSLPASLFEQRYAIVNRPSAPAALYAASVSL